MRVRDLIRDRAVWLFVVLTLALFYRPLSTETFYFRDLYLLFYPKKVFLTDALRAGVLPLWDPFTHAGHPFLATPSNFVFHPSNVLYLLLPTILAFNAVLVIHVLLCMVAAYWLARTCRLSPAAAFVAGVSFGLCGYTLSTANLTPLLLGLPWIPLTIGLAHRALRDGRSVVPAAVAASIPLFSAAAELTAMLFVTLAIWVTVARYERAALPRRLAVLSVVVLGGLGLSLVQTLPATNVIEQSSRAEKRTYDSFTSWSVRPERLPELVIPRFLGRTDTLDDADYWGRSLESDGFPYILSIYFGAPLLLLAFAGAISARMGTEVPRRALALLAVVALLLSLGRNLPGFRLIYDYVPLVTIFRFPVKAMIAMLLPMSLLAGCGAEAIAIARPVRRSLLIAAAVVLAFLGACAAMIPSGAIANAFSFTAMSQLHLQQLAFGFAHALAATVLVALVVIWSGRNARQGALALATVVALDLAIAGRTVNDYAPRSLFDPPPLADEVGQVIGNGRFHAVPHALVVKAPRNEIKWLARWRLTTLADYNAALFGIPVVYHKDYDGLAPARMSALSKVMPRLTWSERLAMFDKASVSAFVTQKEVPGRREIARLEAPGSPLRLYLNSRAEPARFVSSVLVANDPADALRLVTRSSADVAVVEGEAVPADGCGTAQVQLLDRSFHSAHYRVDAPCRGLVIFAENHYDGWQATIDGRAAPHIRADYAFTAVRVAPGRQTIERRYTAPRLAAGVAGTLSTAGLLAVLFWWERRKTRHRVDVP